MLASNATRFSKTIDFSLSPTRSEERGGRRENGFYAFVLRERLCALIIITDRRYRDVRSALGGPGGFA